MGVETAQLFFSSTNRNWGLNPQYRGLLQQGKQKNYMIN
jgi:hypothetical protein